MEIWQAIVLGFVQGLTEFLPVSSSGHLVFFQQMFNLDHMNMFFDIMLHLGTLVAVCVIFYKDILALFRRPFKNLLFLIIASVPAALVGFLLEDWIETHFFGGAYLSIGFLLTASILLGTEIYAKRRKKVLPLSYRSVIPMGFAQALAVLPGISRSGSTIAAGTLAGANSDDVASFSFLMSIPVILGSFLISLLKGLMDGELQTAVSAGGANFIWCILIGTFVAALSGLFAIKVMLKAIKKANYKWFSLYLALLAIVCVVLHTQGFFG